MKERIHKETIERKIVLKEELLFILNRKLLEYKECENCYFVDILELDEETEDGCNWIGANIKSICRHETSEKCGPFVSKVLSETGKQYNIKK
jgi:hypothetical protein